jgi:beta-mannanase
LTIPIVCALALLAVSCGGTGSTVAAKGIPSGGKDAVFWGFFSNFRDLSRVPTVYGRAPAVITQFSDWHFDFPPCAQIAAIGSMPLVVWEPWYAGQMDSISLSDITSGAWDTYITKWGKQAADYGKPVMVRWGHEMNGNWYPWSGPRNGNDPALYITAYRRVHDLVRKAGARNVIWVWSPNCNSVPDTPENAAERYYPGDRYVDWIAIDGYNWGTSRETTRWQSFDEIFGQALADAARYAPKKPVMIGEIASTSLGGDKVAWVSAFLGSVEAQYPNLKGWVWFNSNKETDWSFENDADTRALIKQTIARPEYDKGRKRLLAHPRAMS